jgi:excisionase family DNA binding protein
VKRSSSKTRAERSGAWPVLAGTSLAQQKPWEERGSFENDHDDPLVYCGLRLALKERKESRRANALRKIRSLRDHPEPYVTTTELAKYWLVSRKQIYKQIEAGTLKAIRLGPRLLRISTAEALDFEKRAKMTVEHDRDPRSHHAAEYKTRSR